MKDVIVATVYNEGEYGNFHVKIEGNDAEICGALACILTQLIEDGKHDLIIKAMDYSSDDINYEN